MPEVKEKSKYIELPCDSGFVHINRFRPDDVSLTETNLRMLSDAERKRTAAYFNESDGKRYAGVHIMLRVIMSRYTNCQPQEIRFAFSEPYGKPMLHEIHNLANIHFNLSYRGEWALLAVADKIIGADTEQHIRINDMDQFAKNFFSEKERQWLLEAENDTTKYEKFFRLWTLKEAYIKAIGKGLSFPLQDFSILINKDEILLELPRGKREDWVFLELEAPKHYKTAVCYSK